MSYYTRWKLVIGTTYFQNFLRAAYAQGISDLKTLNPKASFLKPNFTSLLCGVGNEETACSFIQFVINKNPNSKIYIIDLGTEQINAVKKLVARYFAKYDITIRQTNALNLLSLLKKSSDIYHQAKYFNC